MAKILRTKGQSIVELTLLTPLILVALYVPFDFGMMIFTGHQVQNVVRDGVRVAATTDGPTNAKAAALAQQIHGQLPSLLVSVSSSKRVTVTYLGDATTCQKVVTVAAQGTYNFFLYRLIALLGFSPPSPVLISRSTRMRYEFQPDSNGGSGTPTLCSATLASGTYPP